MREIKFRAWEMNYKEIIDVDSINFETKIINTECAWRMFSEVILMQYTGLKDVKGVEIFEGDIVIGKSLDFQGMGVVQYFPPRFEIIGAKQHEGLFRVLESCCEVIGNIYENPELLEGK